MKASFYRGNRTFETGTVPMPVPAEGEALLRVRQVGICGTDLHIFQGHLDYRVPHGGIIGHETLRRGRHRTGCRAVSSEATASLSSLVQFCGTCRACRMGATYPRYTLRCSGST